MQKSLALVGTIVLAVSAPSRACRADLAAQGKQLAQRLCAVCHMNAGQGEKSGPMGVPSFRAVANRRGQSHAHIVEWLRTKRPPMPDHKVTWHEADALAAFIMSLRNGQAN